MKKRWLRIFAFVFLWGSIPILLILAIQENGTLKIENETSLEELLPFYVAMYVQEDFEKENIKAMAVICRSNLKEMIRKDDKKISNLKAAHRMVYKEMYIKRKKIYQNVIEACKETTGEVLKYNGSVCYCPFFYMSSGTTRDAFAIFKEHKYPYLISVPSYKDELCDKYVSYHYFSSNDFINVEIEKKNEKTSIDGNNQENDKYKNLLQVLECDQSGYVLWIKVGNQILGGESFREKYGLSSSCFTIEESENQIRITCKGRGHGFGYSQYGANEMAKDGNNYLDLLKHYFPLLNIE